MSSPSLPSAFRRLAWSSLAALVADQLGLAAAPIVAVLVLGAGVGETGLLQTAQTLPFLLLAIPAGLLADRIRRRRLMAAAEAVRAGSLIAILILAAGGHLTLSLFAVLGFLGASGTVAYTVTAPSLVPALVPRESLAAANGRLELTRSAAFIAGPALGGALVGWIGGTPAFAVAAILSVIAVILLAGLDEPSRPTLPPRHPLKDIADGARFVATHRLLSPILVTAIVFNIAFFMLQAVYVPYAVHRLGLGASGVGITLAAYGAGMMSGALLAPRITRVLPFGTVVAIGPITGLAAALAMALTIWVPSPLLAALGYFLIGVGPVLWQISTTTLRQLVTPERLIGRVSSMITVASYGSRPIGAALGALIGGGFGAETCLIVAAGGFVIQMTFILASPVVRLAHPPEAVA